MCSLTFFVLKYSCDWLGAFSCGFASAWPLHGPLFIFNWVTLIMAQDALKRQFLSLIFLVSLFILSTKTCTIHTVLM